MRGDLHCHTNASDGSMAPQEVVGYAAEIGLDCLAITDHDTMAGTDAAQETAEQKGLRLIEGLEVSAYDYRNGKKVHLLCYCPQHREPLLEACRETLEKRTRAGLEMIEKIAGRYPLRAEAVMKYASVSTCLYKQHIAMALAERGYALSVFGDLFQSLFSRKTGFARVEISYPDAREAIGLIKESGGVPVLAHPGVYGNFELLPELCRLGLEGIEAFHPRQSAEDERRALAAAKELGLFVTGGSDFHGFFASRVNPLAVRFTPDKELETFLRIVQKKLPE